LRQAGVRFERLPTTSGDSAVPVDQVLHAYSEEIVRLRREGGYAACDVVALTPDHPQRAELRRKFLDEHTHQEDEVRFFVAGSGLFTLHVANTVYQVLCERGDLISVPSGTPHWFDMGARPSFTAIRLFTDPAGWVARFTGSDIAVRFPRYDD
jgi:1,2-dihydroxy-3-keto-5-methylthiopentene dioxygenase